MESFQDTMNALVEMGPNGLARFQASLDLAWVNEALQATGKASTRRRKLPADQAVWLVLGMALLEDRSIEAVVDHLDLVIDGVGSLAPSAVTQARYRLGAAPIKTLFERVADAWQHSPGLGGYRGLSLYGVDGTCLRVPDSDENFEHFGKPGSRNGSQDAGYPQLRLTALLNLSTRMLSAANFGPYAESEHDLAKALWDKIPHNSLTILDRGLVNYAAFASLVNTDQERHILVRLRKDMKPRMLEELPDGSWLAELTPSNIAKAQYPELPSSIRGRIVGYQHPGGEPGRLFTTLTDPEAYPAKELITLYHERWEIELAFDELKTHMNERKECLRSKKVEGIEQELWGMLLVYNLVRREMLLAAEHHKLDPRRGSFRNALLWIRTCWLIAWQTKPGNIPKHLGQLRSTLDVLFVPERRRKRRFPRHVKIKMSNYKRNRGNRAALN